MLAAANEESRGKDVSEILAGRFSGSANAIDEEGQILARGWNVQVVATQSALGIGLDVKAVELQTGCPVVTSAAVPRLTTADAFVVAPATANTITKLALDIRDTYVGAVLIGGTDGLQPTNASSKDGPLPPFPWHLAVSAVTASVKADDTSSVWKPGNKMGVMSLFIFTAIMVLVAARIME
ncbi:hypothetical protein B0H13DRAFT_1851435 [Mycena leptocephala]|nr:hypothetical protein B0H13DRAFT_1851435 [Mycena leptocephala]